MTGIPSLGRSQCSRRQDGSGDNTGPCSLGRQDSFTQSNSKHVRHEVSDTSEVKPA